MSQKLQALPTTHELVKQFHVENEMVVNDRPTTIDDDTLTLRLVLQEEEYDELEDEVSNLRDGNFDDLETQLAKIAKEVADVIIVACGTLVSLGINTDDVCALVMANNLEKTQYKVKRADGKVMVPPEIKAELKAKIHKQLLDYIREKRSSVPIMGELVD